MRKLLGKRRHRSYKVWKLEEVSHEMLVLRLQHVSSRFSSFFLPSPCLWGKLQNLSLLGVAKLVVICCDVVLRGRRDTSWHSHVSASMSELVLVWQPHNTFALRALHSTLYTPHFTLYTPHSTFHTLHSTLYTLHFILHTLHSTLHTSHSTLYNLHLTIFTLRSTLYTPDSTLYTPHFTLHTAAPVTVFARCHNFTQPWQCDSQKHLTRHV